MSCYAPPCAHAARRSGKRAHHEAFVALDAFLEILPEEIACRATSLSSGLLQDNTSAAGAFYGRGKAHEGQIHRDRERRARSKRRICADVSHGAVSHLWQQGCVRRSDARVRGARSSSWTTAIRASGRMWQRASPISCRHSSSRVSGCLVCRARTPDRQFLIHPLRPCLNDRGHLQLMSCGASMMKGLSSSHQSHGRQLSICPIRDVKCGMVVKGHGYINTTTSGGTRMPYGDDEEGCIANLGRVSGSTATTKRDASTEPTPNSNSGLVDDIEERGRSTPGAMSTSELPQLFARLVRTQWRGAHHNYPLS